jgi:hypothetical protein
MDAMGMTPAQISQLGDFTFTVVADTKVALETLQLLEQFKFTGKRIPVSANTAAWDMSKGTIAGFMFDPKTIPISADTSGLKTAIANAKAWLSTLPKSKQFRIAGVNSVGGTTINAAGGLYDKPTFGVFGEAGPEAIVPLDRPLSMVDPSVRSMSAILQGMTGGRGAVGGAAGPKVNFEAGAFTINLPTGDPKLAAEAVLDRLVAYIG